MKKLFNASIMVSVLALSSSVFAGTYEFHQKISGLSKVAPPAPVVETATMERHYPAVGTVYAGQYNGITDFQFDTPYTLSFGGTYRAIATFGSNGVLSIDFSSAPWGATSGFNGLVFTFGNRVPLSITKINAPAGEVVSVQSLQSGIKAFTINNQGVSVGGVYTYSYSFE